MADFYKVIQTFQIFTVLTYFTFQRWILIRNLSSDLHFKANDWFLNKMQDWVEMI